MGLAPDDLKSTVDLEFALVTFFGQYFTRNETWAEKADGWTGYLARISFLLQQGHHAADIAYFHGEESPVTGLYGGAPVSDVPSGHDYDFVNADTLANRLISDAQPDATPVTLTTGPTYAADAPQRRSRLIGPVTLINVKGD